jgi:hypothetical protein
VETTKAVVQKSSDGGCSLCGRTHPMPDSDHCFAKRDKHPNLNVEGVPWPESTNGKLLARAGLQHIDLKVRVDSSGARHPINKSSETRGKHNREGKH